MKKEEITQKEIDQTNVISGFSPSTLEKYVNEYYGPIDPDDILGFDISKFDTSDWTLMTQEEIDNMIELDKMYESDEI